MGQHLVDGILQLRPEDVPVVLRTHVGESTDGTRIILLTSEWDMKKIFPTFQCGQPGLQCPLPSLARTSQTFSSSLVQLSSKLSERSKLKTTKQPK